jgi:hypothetical protein
MKRGNLQAKPGRDLIEGCLVIAPLWLFFLKALKEQTRCCLYTYVIVHSDSYRKADYSFLL